MAREEIIEKLDKFLAKYSVPDEECYVVYLLVEIRKLLEREGSPKFPLVRFYCDWTVHTKKDRSLQAIKEIVDRIDGCFSIQSHYLLKSDEIFNFLKMAELRKEFNQLFKRYNLQTNILGGDISWASFVDTLTKALSEQPILNPKAGIKSISLVPFGKGRNAINIEFTDGRTDAMVGGER
ncbi:hypothetical protein HYT17_03095 [Candidatus Microgenomates bacterium]|nr:hypothetical protein [Candidatus Microgenomates bacterium]